MILYRGNVERIVESKAEAEKLKAEGFKEMKSEKGRGSNDRSRKAQKADRGDGRGASEASVK